MFSRRRNLDRRKHYSREFFETLLARLAEAGFSEQTVVLPQNYSSVDPKRSEEPVGEFLSRERNFAAVILKATSPQHAEMLKVLFINSNAEAIFVDDTFPRAQSEPGGMYFESPDPGRAYAVFEYFFEYLNQPSVSRFVTSTLGGVLGLIWLLAEVSALIERKQGLLQVLGQLPAWSDVVGCIAAAWLVYRLSATPSGLWIKPKRELKVIYLINMALKGELRDNPVVQLVVTVLGGLIVAGIVYLLGHL
jgi:hypothetical protein